MYPSPDNENRSKVGRKTLFHEGGDAVTVHIRADLLEKTRQNNEEVQ